MKCVNIQFFALPQEIKSCLKVWSDFYDLKIGRVSLFPSFNYKALNVNNIDSSVFEIGGSNYFVLSTLNIKIGSTKLSEFEDNNPNMLFIQVGQLSSDFLKESWMYSLKTLEDEAALKIWMKIGHELKKMTLTGGWGIYEPTGVKKYYKNIRYTLGAKQAFTQGTKILPSIGNNVFFELLGEKE